MVFDFVGALGAPKGELEVNALLDYVATTRQLNWTPEIECSFLNGYGVELELPLENTTLNEYKITLQGITLQGTLGRLDGGRMIHGWQAGGRRKIDEKEYGAELLYLNDYKFSDRWSTVNMIGIRHTALGRSGDVVGLVNNSVFYSHTRRSSLGLELNSEIPERNWRYRFTPQVQYTFEKNKIFQFGGGPSRLNEENLSARLP